MLSCKTPDVTAIPENVLKDFIGYDSGVMLHVHLGDFFEVWYNRTTFRFPFDIFGNPTVEEWDSVRGFDVYDGHTHISILVRSANGISS